MTRWILSGAAALWLGAVPFAEARAEEPTVLDESRFDHAVAVHNVEVTEGKVHGVVENRTEHRVRDVQLLIRRDYRWPNEYRPGDDNPSRVEIHTLPAELAPGERVDFTHTPEQPLPDRPGDFDTRVEVLSFAELVPPAVGMNREAQPEEEPVGLRHTTGHESPTPVPPRDPVFDHRR